MTSSYNSVVLAGGGSRCFWHLGFWREAAGALALAPRQIACVSASSAMACMLVAELTDEALRLFMDVTRRNPRNVHWRNLWSAERLFPHERMYRASLGALLDRKALSRVHDGPDLRILLARLPRWLGPRTGFLAAGLAYNFDKRIRRVVHPTLPRALGIRPEVVPARSCSTPEALVDLIIASSCTPPMTTLQQWTGAYALDGGAVDNVPACALDGDPGQVLVLLTRQYPRLPQIGGRTYVQPSRPIPISAWDYANPAGIQATYDLGRRDGEAFARSGERSQALSLGTKMVVNQP
jgi:predicted acylesterase/phospholipase RssA